MEAVMEGMIFDISRGSCVDGPGIRTTVFFKGCNLKCRWCHNPEGQCGGAQLMFYSEKCIGCGECLRICPHRLKTCEACGACAEICPAGARKLYGRLCTADEIMEEVRRDRAFYECSGGGVTFSGGECMLQTDFLKMLLHECKECGIHTAVDTAGAVPWEGFERILPDTDLFLYDCKCLTETLHIAGTGVSNRLILDNLKKLSETGKDIIIRIPVVGGFNDSMEEMAKIAAYLKEIRCRDVELLPYHRIGEDKYDALSAGTFSREPFSAKKPDFQIPSREEMQAFEKLFERTHP